MIEFIKKVRSRNYIRYAGIDANVLDDMDDNCIMNLLLECINKDDDIVDI